MSQKLVTDHGHWLDRYIHFWQDFNSARKLIALNLRTTNVWRDIYIYDRIYILQYGLGKMLIYIYQGYELLKMV